MAFLFEQIKDEKLKDKYEVIFEGKLEDLNSNGCLLKHKKSGARVVLLSNDDENKVFNIGFRTPPYNNTGLQHIIEHTVLCGSRKYPVKDPFVELCKGSLNTFLNAMTYPDKTVYPVASCNLVDFKNIMDVYMDAVFYPKIYEHEEIFMQEGWHYELENVDAPLKYNGVVYNEMKGAYSSADELLSRYTFQTLFPDTTYGCESGGDPDEIPNLTRQEYLDYHKKFYHPANCYIYVYGDMDMEERLAYLDKEYLSKFDKEDVPNIGEESKIELQSVFEKPVEKMFDYAITEEETEEDNSYLSYNVVAGTSLDAKLYLAMQVLDYVLVMAPGAKLKDALLGAGIGDDVYSSFESSIYQPVYSIITKGANNNQKDEFLKIIFEVCNSLVSDKIEKNVLLAGINYYEFKYREADFGSFPKGLMYSLKMMDSWLYDENQPFMHIEAGKTFEALKKEVEDNTGYFEGLIERYILQNTHASTVILNPKKNLTQQREETIFERLRKYKETLSNDELEMLVRKTNELKHYQEEPSSQEALKTIPMLNVKDIKTTPAPLYNQEMFVDGSKIIWHNIFTNKIAYINLSFDCDAVTDEDIPYMGLLCNCLGLMNTENYTYGDLSTQIDLHTGGIYTNPAIYLDIKDENKMSIRLDVSAKALYGKVDKALELTKEMLLNTRFNDYKRLKEILDLIKSRMEDSMTNAGHRTAMLCATAQFSKNAWYSNRVKGYEFYLEICKLVDDFDNVKENVASKLDQLIERIFNKDRLIVSYTSDEDGYEVIKRHLPAFLGGLCNKKYENETRNYVPLKQSLGLTSSSQVQYVARCGNYKKAGFEYTGALKVLKVIFSYEYLWINIRVKGGAYGCMSGFGFNGDSYLLSYRDPNLAKTNEIYENAPEYLRNFTVSDRDMEKYIIGTIGGMDTPMTPAMVGSRSFGAYMSNVSIEDYQKERNEVLQANQDSIRELADLLTSIMEQNYFCVVGNANKIQKESKMFDVIKPLVK